MMKKAGSLLWVLSFSMLVSWGSGCSSTSAPIEEGGLIGVLDFPKYEFLECGSIHLHLS